MNGESAAWRILGLVVILLTVAVPAWVAYDIYGRGTIPEKQVELFQLSTINPLKDLSVLGEEASFALKYQNQTFNNIVIASAWITNKGKAPILPTDFYEHLSVTVDKPWRIVTVEDRGIISDIRVHWTRVSDNKFEAEPTLLNPGDRIDPVIYLNNPAASETKSQTETQRANSQVECENRKSSGFLKSTESI